MIDVKNLCVGYGKTSVLSGVSLSLEKGEFVSIIGTNGSGKSTLVKALLSLKKPESGAIEFGEGLKKNEIGYLPQQTMAQKDFPASVYEVVLSGCLNSRGIRPFYSAKERKKALETMELLGITDLKNRSYRDLSGGQQQRVLLSRALCATKKLILLDEPVAGLDPIVTAELYDLIEKINKSGVTVIMVTHDLSAAIKCSRHILCMTETEWFFGSREEFLKSKFADFMRGSETGD